MLSSDTKQKLFSLGILLILLFIMLGFRAYSRIQQSSHGGVVSLNEERLDVLLESDITFILSENGEFVVVEPAEIPQILDIVYDDQGRVDSFSVAPDMFEGLFGFEFDTLREASFSVRGDTVVLHPSVSRIVVDYEILAKQIRRSVGDGYIFIPVPTVTVEEPVFATEDAQALRIQHIVSSFTTYHPCCADRVENIHAIADEVDGVLVLPGEEFSLNGYVGERTEDDGFVPAGTILSGELVDTVGGGVSQFATTLYNAVFWGGYDDVTHSPHSRHFDRYPEGIEATVSWPLPDLIFKNTTDSGILIDTEYTGNSITVRIFGDNDGRIVRGYHKNGSTTFDVVKGGEHARIVTADRSEPRNIKDFEIQYIPDIYTDRFDEQVVDSGSRGWTTTISRSITQEGVTVADDSWDVVYRPVPRRIKKHPCALVNGQVLSSNMCRLIGGI